MVQGQRGVGVKRWGGGENWGMEDGEWWDGKEERERKEKGRRTEERAG